MSYDMRKRAEKEAYHDVKETCPHVDAALNSAADAIKEQTSSLREALIDAHVVRMEIEEQLQDATEQLEDAQSEIRDLNEQIRLLTEEVRDLTRHIEDMEA